MSHRYRMYPTESQAETMTVHCAHARFVWNIALEQCDHAKMLGQYADQKLWSKNLAEARAHNEWLGAGASTIQQTAFRDLQQAFRNWWKNPGHFGHPKWRVKGRNEGFAVRDLFVKKLNRKWASISIPKLGHVKFRLSRPLPETKSARVTLDRSGRWHVSFTAIPPEVEGPGGGTIVGIDRGVAINYQCSDGRKWNVSGRAEKEKARKLRLQRKRARQQKGSNRRECTRRKLAKISAKEADRRKDSIEKITTELAQTADIIRIEDLKVTNMMKSAKGTVENPGKNVAQKRGLNKAISEVGWSIFSKRLEDKIGDRLEKVPAAFTSQRCSCCKHVDKKSRNNQADFLCTSCGYSDNADLNAAKNIAAGLVVFGRGGDGAIRPPGETSTCPVASDLRVVA